MSLFALTRAIELGLIFSVLSLGEYITVNVLNSPDLTVDGSFVTGGCVCAVLTIAGHPYLALIAAMIAGGMAGCVTAFLQTKMKIQGLLAGILTMTGLYSINLHILSNKANLSLTVPGAGKSATIFSYTHELLMLLAVVGLCALFLYLFFKTNLGLMLRATGDNEEMIRSSSVNVDAMKFLGLGLSNAFVALSGALQVQFLNFADVNSGTGMLVLGLAGIIIGEAIFRKKTIGNGLLACIFGAVIYRILYAIALELGFQANDMKLVSAVLVAVTISIPYLQSKRRKHA